MVRYHKTVIETLNSIKTKQDYPMAAQRGYEKINTCISFGMLLVSSHVSRYEKPKPYVIISKLLVRYKTNPPLKVVHILR